MTTSGAAGRLTGKTVLITGARAARGPRTRSGSPGRGRRCSPATCCTTRAARSRNGCGATGLEVTYRGLDVTDATAWQALVAEIGRVDVLVNNAGIIHVAPIQEQARGAWDATLAVNLTGAMLGIQAVVPQMRSRGGSVINIASIFGVVGRPGTRPTAPARPGSSR